MKKIILPLLAAILMSVSLTSCEHQTMRTVDVTVYPNQWVRPANANYFQASYSWDELDEDVVDYGMVNAYLLFDGQQHQLPYVYPFPIDNYDAAGNYVSTDYIPENIRCQFSYRTITFIIEDLDGMEPEAMQDVLRFRCVAVGD